MKGVHYIRLENKRISFDIELKRKITIITGDSATGKSTLINEIDRLLNDGRSYKNNSTAELLVLSGKDIRNTLIRIRMAKSMIILADESLGGLTSNEFAKTVNKSSCYFVIVTREMLSGIPYSVDSVVKMVTDKRNRHTVEPIYKNTSSAESVKCRPYYVVCEDSKSGFIFLKLIDTTDSRVFTALNKDGVIDKALEKFHTEHKPVLIFADGAAFGPYAKRLVSLQTFKGIDAYLPESFEFVLLHSPIFENDSQLQKVLNNVYNHIDSSCISAEQYFEQLLNEKIKETGTGYGKSGLNACLVDNCCGKGRPCQLLIKEKSIDKVQGLLEQLPIDFSSIFIDKTLNSKVVRIGNHYEYKPN